MGGLNAETAGNLLSGGQDIYNMVEDNKNLRDNYKQDHQRLLHEQQLNREKKTNILEQNLAARRARVAAMGISGDGSAAAEQYLTTPIRIWPKMIIIITMTPSKIVGTSVIKSVKTPSTEPLTAQKAC